MRSARVVAWTFRKPKHPTTEGLLAHLAEDLLHSHKPDLKVAIWWQSPASPEPRNQD